MARPKPTPEAAAPSCATIELNGGVGCRGTPWIRIHNTLGVPGGVPWIRIHSLPPMRGTSTEAHDGNQSCWR